MSATDELRRMLDERGVEYQWTDKKHSVPSCEIVQWWSGDDVSAEYIEYHDGSTVLHIHTSMLHATPEQAIAAMLGSCNCSNNCTNGERTGTCHTEETERFECLDSRYKSFDYNPYITVHVMECSECGGTYEHVNGDYEFCPRCGRRIEVDV